MTEAPPTHESPAAEAEHGPGHHQSFWLWVMCLTGVDYFSTLGYQPSIAYEATGLLTPFATVVLVLVTLLGALPVYAYVAKRSPHGQGSIAMLERLMRGWWAKLFVLVLLGFAATDFVITKTLSAADAAEHVLKNPFWDVLVRHAPASWQGALIGTPGQIGLTMLLLTILGAVFLRGFREVIGLAVVIVGAYLLLNLVIVGSSLSYLASDPQGRQSFERWTEKVQAGAWEFTMHGSVAVGHQDPGATHAGADPAELFGKDAWGIALICVLLFPKLALGLSGFETGVAVMPLIKGDPGDTPAEPAGRVRNARKLLLTAALIMSFFLLGSSIAISTLIAPHDLQKGGQAENRALAFLAHGGRLASGESAADMNPLFGEAFGTLYDISTVIILWFAGASAMAGLLNLVPQYLPRYGMAPDWARAMRPLVVLFTAINLFVTWQFRASVHDQGAAYATGVLVLISSACVASVVDRWRSHAGPWYQRVAWPFVLVTAVFAYTTAANIIEKPDGLKIASWFILAIVVSSVVSRLWRSTELRFAGFHYVDAHSKFLWDSLKHIEFPVLVPHRPGGRTLAEKEAIIRREHRLDAQVPIVFVEAFLGDPSEFYQAPVLEVKQEEGSFILRVRRCASIAHVIASMALELSKVGKPPEIHFGWSAESPMAANLGFLLFGEGNVPWMVRELIQHAEPKPERQPRVVIG